MRRTIVRSFSVFLLFDLLVVLGLTSGHGALASPNRMVPPQSTSTPTPTPSFRPPTPVSSAERSRRPSAVIHVPGDYPTIAQALSVSHAGDTVQVNPGTYAEGPLYLPAGVSMIGSGWQNTTINGNGANVVVYTSPNVSIQGFTIRGSSGGYFDAGIWTSDGPVAITGNRITGNSAGIWAWCFDPATCNIQISLDHNIVDGNSSNGINSNEYAIFTLRNNTVTRNGGAGVILNHASSLAEDNIIANNTSDGLANNAGATVRYNDVWGNQRDYVGVSMGIGGISANPLFRDPSNGNYQLYAGSPAVGTGTPSGTDMGALAYTPVGTSPASVTLTPGSSTTWQVSWTSTGAAGYFVYYGSCTRQNTTVVPVSGSPWYQINNVTADDVTFVAVSSYNAGLQESVIRLATGITVPCPAAPTSLEAGAFPNQQIRLQWQDNASNEVSILVERAPGTLNTITHTAYSQIAILPANTTVYTDTSPALETTYWYRVRAANNNGNSPYSNESYNTTFSTAPNNDERYLLVLINEARASPGTFGYPLIAPVPPMAYNSLLNYAAHSHSQSILNSGFLIGHCDPIGRCPTERAHAVGYNGGVGENLIQGMSGPSWVESSNQAFMDSQGHRDNMLCPCFTEAGLGHTYDPAKGGASYWKGQYTETFSSRSGVVIPNLPSGIVIPYNGTTSTLFTFIANYYNASGYAPTQSFVYVDGVPYAMTLSTGTAANGTYRRATLLPPGNHPYYFSFAFPGGAARLPVSGNYNVSVTGTPLSNHIYLPFISK